MRIIDADRLKERIANTADLGGWIGDTIAQIKQLAIKYIDSVPSVDMPTWTPCSERLPEMRENVLLYIPLREGVRQHGIRIGYCDEDDPIPEDEDGEHNFWGMKTYGGKWHVTGWGYYDEPIPIAWMPLPAIWEEGESNG